MSRNFRSLNEQNKEFLIRLVAIVGALVLIVIGVCAVKVITANKVSFTPIEELQEEALQPTETEVTETVETAQESESADATGSYLSSNAIAEEDEIPFYDTFMFVGDSRFVAMSAFAEEEDTFVCETGVSYSFLSSHYNALRSYESGNCAIIIGLGVNNLTQAPDYIDFLNTHGFESDVYFLTVNPTEPGKEYNVSDDAIRRFNEQMAQGQGVYTLIDTYDRLVEHGYSTQDGVHYYDSTTEYLYQLIKSYFGYDDGPVPVWQGPRRSG